MKKAQHTVIFGTRFGSSSIKVHRGHYVSLNQDNLTTRMHLKVTDDKGNVVLNVSKLKSVADAQIVYNLHCGKPYTGKKQYHCLNNVIADHGYCLKVSNTRIIDSKKVESLLCKVIALKKFYLDYWISKDVYNKTLLLIVCNDVYQLKKLAREVNLIPGSQDNNIWISGFSRKGVVKDTCNKK